MELPALIEPEAYHSDNKNPTLKRILSQFKPIDTVSALMLLFSYGVPVTLIFLEEPHENHSHLNEFRILLSKVKALTEWAPSK
jgi:hypothetical protein